jgi:capsular polysaccharide transport system permease protein
MNHNINKKLYSVSFLRHLLSVKLRIVHALILRETITAYGKSFLGYIWAFITPICGISILVLFFTLAQREPPFGQSLALFFATGWLPYQFYKKISDSLMNVFDANFSLLSFPIVVPSSAIIARFLLLYLTNMLIIFIFYLGLITFSLADFPHSLIGLIIALNFTSLLGLGIGLTSASIARFFVSWKQCMSILSRPLFFISGIFFIPSLLNEEILNFLIYNPLLHAIEWVRNSTYTNYDSLVLNKSYLISFVIILLIFGFLLERVTRKINT